MSRVTSVLEDIPVGLREFTAYAMQVLSILFVVTQHVVYLGSTVPGLHTVQAVAASVYGAGGPSSLVIVQIAAVLLAHRTRAAQNTAAIAIVVFSAAAVEQFIAVFPVSTTPMVWPAGDSGRVVDQLITLSFILLALVVTASLYRSAQSAARRPVFALPDERGPFADEDDDFAGDPEV